MRLTQHSFVILLALLPGLPLQAQEDSSVAHPSLGFRVGRSWTVGDWRGSPISPQIDYFGGGFSLQGDFEFVLGRSLTMGLAVEVSTFDGTEWEEFVSTRGGSLDVSARMIVFSASLRPHIPIGGNFLLKIDFGPAFALSEASEQYAGLRFVNNSLGSSIFGATGGCELLYRATRQFGFSVHWGVHWFPSALSYGRGNEYGVIWMPVVAGVRLSF